MSDTAHTMSPELAQFVEDVGLTMEESGHPRIAGRIVGWLLVCDPPHQSFNDLVEVLGASKGSISNMTRMLLQADLIERFAVPGERQTFFRIRPGAWVRVLRRRIDSVSQLSQVAARGLALMEKHDGDGDYWRLREMQDFYQFISRKIPLLIEEYESERATAPSE
jgi:hypothetical protein